MPLASPSPLPPISLRNGQAAMCTKHIQFQIEELKLIRPLSFEFYLGRLLIEPNRVAATYRRDQEACGDEGLPCQPHATPGPSSCPNGGGDLALTLRRSVRERCVRCATQLTPRALLFGCETELRYALGSKARSAQPAMSTLADKRPITPYTSGPRTPCPVL